MTPEGVPVTAAHLPRLSHLLRSTRRAPSEYSLANLYLYRDRHQYRLVDGEKPFLFGTAYDGERHVLPLCPLDATVAAGWLDHADCVYPLEESEARAVATAAAGRFALDDRDSDADYLYDARRLSRLGGARAKRAQAARFDALGPRIESFDVAAASRILAAWLVQAGRGPDHADAHECAEAISRFRELGLEGMSVWIGDEPAAFLLAGPSRVTDRVVHFAKGLVAYPGVYPWMFSRFAARAGTPHLNFEQDLGKPGLAQAKRALAPVSRLRKFRLRRSM